MSRDLLAAAWFCVLLVLPAQAAEEEPQVLPEKNYRLDLPVRKPDEKDITPATRTVSADVYLDKKSNRRLYVSGEEGTALAIVPLPKGEGDKEAKGAKWHYRLVLPVRQWDEKEFGKTTPKIGVEVYRDEPAGHWVYVSHTGSLAVLPIDQASAGQLGQEPQWRYRLPLKVRNSRKFEIEYFRQNIEVYRDEQTGAFIYVAENGNLAVVAGGKADEVKEVIPPVWSHAMDLKARSAREDEFSAKTASFGVEVYQDKNRGAWLYATEASTFTVVPWNKAINVKEAKLPLWLHRLQPPATGVKKWSAEIFRNLDTDHVITITSRGALAVVPTK